ncbi:hypothetical protein [Haloplasma contractile]|uniref:Uncharacterized protein n=1 Tax=Haloplasma contractile SSD-17B TaxID=1033810 RepID=F7PTL8_9MOLU|nr:hypothetical protein [Haloplasma contractile]ERJ12182.1 hypothetical protein HLPCO_001709 [Haloplasma contractile SSD-17B]
MSVSNQFIKYVKFDDEKRILVSVQPKYQAYLQEQKIRQSLKKAVVDVIKDEFVKLEIGKNICRITVKKGTEEQNLARVKKELVNGLEMAMKFMGKMGK